MYGADHVFTTIYEDTEEYKKLKEKGFNVLNIPYVENF